MGSGVYIEELLRCFGGWVLGPGCVAITCPVCASGLRESRDTYLDWHVSLQSLHSACQQQPGSRSPLDHRRVGLA